MIKENKKKNTCEYYNKFEKENTILEIKKDHKKKLQKEKYKTCGRIFIKRIMGKSTFLKINDMLSYIQVYVSEKYIKNYKETINNLNLGDIIAVEGNLFETKTKELSLKAYEIIILSKNINLFPDKRIGLIDKEICYRQRYLDLIVNKKTRKKFIIRSKIIQEIRNFFIKKKYIEVETPIMQKVTEGADAKPFETYNNYMNTKLYLRVSPELSLKRLIVGGFEKIFEIGKNFRNESISNRHHPEFTAIEFYEAYSNYKNLIKLTEELFHTLAKKILKQNILKFEKTTIDFSKKFDQISFHDAIIKYTNMSKKDLKNKEYLKQILKNENIKIEENLNLGKIQSKIFEHFAEKNLIQPTFVLHYPVDVSPLAKRCEEDESLTERFELYINGKELANGFSELNDPIDQEKRFKEQIENKNKNINYDEDYINALKYGLPPTAGEGIGIDRLIMLFTNSTSIKDVIFFPIMKIK